MLIFVLWQDKKPNERRALERVAPSLKRLFEPILGKEPMIHSRSSPEAKLVWLERPVKRWKPALVERDGERFALAGEYPVAGNNSLLLPPR